MVHTVWTWQSNAEGIWSQKWGNEGTDSVRYYRFISFILPFYRQPPLLNGKDMEDWSNKGKSWGSFLEEHWAYKYCNTAVVLEEASERHTKQTEATLFFFLLGFFFCLFLPSSTHWSGSPVAFVLQGRYEEGISFQGTCLGLLELKAGNIKLQLQIWPQLTVN